MPVIEDRYYFHKKGNISIIGVLNTDNGEWNDKHLHVFSCKNAQIFHDAINLSNAEINAILFPENADNIEWVKANRDQISKDILLKIGEEIGGEEVIVPILPGEEGLIE